jgi:PST family polysaccharide transporter
MSSFSKIKNDSSKDSYRRMLRSTSIIGGASVINILVGMLRFKVAALVLGPAGIGLIGIMQSLLSTASAVVSLGLNSSGTRQIAQAKATGDSDSVMRSRRALFWGTLILATLGGAAFWFFRHLIAEHILSDSSLSDSVGWLAIGVVLTVVSGSQSALLNGLQRIGDLARVTIGAALISTFLGISSLLVLGNNGLLFFVLAMPLASFLLGYWYVIKLPHLVGKRAPIKALVSEWSSLARLGVVLMITGVMWSIAHLTVRSYIQSKLGIVALGHFQAAWTIGTTYLGVVLVALGTDFYPRLSAAIHDHDYANKLINQQTEVGLLLAAPILLIMLGLAPWILELLYSKDFLAGVGLLRWQVMADVLKVVSWPLSYCILASGNGRAHLLTELLAIVLFVGLTFLLLPILGIEAVGISFLVIFLVLLPITYFIAWRKTKFRWSLIVIKQIVGLLLIAFGVFFAGVYSKFLGLGFGMCSAIVLGLYGLAKLGHMADLNGRVGTLSQMSRNLMIKMRIWRE